MTIFHANGPTAHVRDVFDFDQRRESRELQRRYADPVTVPSVLEVKAPASSRSSAHQFRLRKRLEID